MSDVELELVDLSELEGKLLEMLFRREANGRGRVAGQGAKGSDGLRDARAS